MLTREQARTLIGSFAKEFANDAGLEPVDASELQIQLEAFVLDLDTDNKRERAVWEEAAKQAQELATCYQRNGEYERAAALFEMREECERRRQRRV
jgi:hypothetical protein